MDSTDQGFSGPPSPRSPDSILGRTLGDFRVRQRLEGGGGFGALYLADQRALEREAVVKILLTPDRSGAAAQRFLREAHLASSLDHPFAAHIYAFGAEPDGLLWIAMERVRGTSLDRFLETQGPLPLRRFVPLLERICEVVAAAHEQGITHRDIKPANVMVVARAGQLSPKLLDFGIAKVRATGTVPVLRDEPETGTSGTLRDQLIEAASLVLTNAQRYVGTPHYMSPEQWTDASNVDARSDIYGLGVMSFQLLTGGLPFDGSSMEAIARAHTVQPLPPLGPGFPPALDAALRRATAKERADRYASALDFARAVRDAAGMEPEQRALPQLSEELRQLALHDGPQPIAEAVAALESARQLPQALEAIRQVARVSVRYVGLLALASRARVGGREQPVPPTYAQLGGEGLTDQAWLELAQELCRPFAHCREAHPLPELVDLFFKPEQETSPTALLPEPPSRSDLSEDALFDIVTAELARLEAFLQRLLFVFAYPLCVAHAGLAERWMGVRRRRRATSQLPPDAVGEGQVFLGDDDGQPVLFLSPLIQAMTPAPSAPEEIFLFDSRGRHGAKLVALPLGFERQDEGLWDWLSANVAPLSRGETDGHENETRPYLGLSAFSLADAPNFFGREQEAEAFANRLRESPFQVLLGPSGSGKSSFLQAGVLPLLPNWVHLTVRPGPSPLLALATRLNVPELRNQPQLLRNALLSMAQARGTNLVLIVDQFEELLTLCSDADERAAYAQALMEIVRGGPDQPLRVVLTLRDDFLIRVQALPAFQGQLAQALHLIGTPAPADLLRILETPARRAGYAFEDPELPKQMVHAVHAQAGALALISFTASKLWELRDRHLKRMTRRAYQALGGVGGALAQHAESTLSSMSAPEQPLVREVFRHLVTGEGTRAVLTRRELGQLLGGGPAAERVLEVLIQARLLVASEDSVTDDRIEMVHEALLVSWPRLAQWQREDAEGVRMRDALRAAARQWEDRQRSTGLLWRGDALLEYRLWRTRYRGAITLSEEAFAATSLREEARESAHRRTWLLSAFMVLVLLSGGLAYLARQASRSARDARDQLAAQYQEQGRELSIGGEPMRALTYLERALALGADDPPLRFLVARGKEALGKSTATLRHDGATLALDYAPGGGLLATGSTDGTARLWDATSGALQRTFARGEHVWAVHFSPDGRSLATGEESGRVTVFDVTRGTVMAEQRGCSGRVDRLIFAPAGALLLASCHDGSALLLDARTLAPVRGPLFPEGRARDNTPTTALFSPDGQRVAVSTERQLIVVELTTQRPLLSVPRFATNSLLAFSADSRWVAATDHGRVKLWDGNGEQATVTLEEPTDSVIALAYSPDGEHLWLTNANREVVIWALHPPTRLQSHLRPVSPATVLALSPDGRFAFTGGQGGGGQLWNASTGELQAALEGHTGPLWGAVFSPDSHGLATASFDRTTRLWSVFTTDYRSKFLHPDSVLQARFVGPTDLLTLSSKGHLRRWTLNADHPTEEQQLTPWDAGDSADALSPGGQAVARCQFGPRVIAWRLPSGVMARELVLDHELCSALAWAPDRQTLAVATHRGGVVLWNSVQGTVGARLQGEQEALVALAFSPDGRFLASGGTSGPVRVWRTADAQLVTTLVGHTGPVSALTWSPDGQRLATVGGDRQGHVWDVASGLLVTLVEGLEPPSTSVTFLGNRELIATGSETGLLQMWSAKDGKLIASEPAAGAVEELATSPDGAWLAAADRAGQVRVWPIDRFAGKAAELTAFTRCHVPYELEGTALTPVALRCR